VLTILQPGDVFGEIALLDGKEPQCQGHDGARAARCTDDRHPKIWSKLLELRCGRLRKTRRRGPSWARATATAARSEPPRERHDTAALEATCGPICTASQFVAIPAD
jgi:CRP-like cAMP-binding protein